MSSLMKRETRAIPQLVSAQCLAHFAAYRDAANRLKAFDPALVVTVARGTSDNAALYFKYLWEMTTGIPVASVGPSIASVYGTNMKLARAACLSISQSGRSPDLVAFQKMAQSAGALNIALLNTVDSPLGQGASCVLPVGSGQEKAVAATKSFVLSLTAIAAITAFYNDNEPLIEALNGLPESLTAAIDCDWSYLADTLVSGRSLYVIGRGPGFSVAQEAALKFKETCELHAESYSSAEVLHGPIQLAAGGLAALVFLSRDEARKGLVEAVERMSASGMDVFVVDPAGKQPVLASNVAYLPCVSAPDPLLDPISQITSFYVFAEQLAGRLDLDPDSPRLLKKITETV